MASKKLNVTLREDLLERIDAYADENGMTRSGFLSVAAVQYLNAVEAAPSVNKMLAAMAAAAEGAIQGDLTPEEADAQMKAIKATYTAITKRG